MKLAVEKSIFSLEEKKNTLKEKLIAKGIKPEEDTRYQEIINQIQNEMEHIYSNLEPWDVVQIARALDRPQFLDYIEMIFTDFIEIHGDRLESDDNAIIGGFATIGKIKVIVVGQERGKTIEEALKVYNRGMPTPNGYRKAFRLFELADQFNLPLITFIDTPGADPRVIAEEKGQGSAIAFNLQKMSELKVPIITVCIGEGGSGGALALGVGNINLMLKYSIYSVISPEGAAAILFRDSSMAPEAAKSLKLTSEDLLNLNLVDEVIFEPIGAAHRNPEIVAQNLRETLIKYLEELLKIPKPKLMEKRLEKLLQIGFFEKR